MKKITFFIVLGIVSISLSAKQIFVDGSVFSEGDGTKSTPFKTLTKALEQSMLDDEILMTVGTYFPSDESVGSQQTSFVITKGVSIRGGYNSSFETITQNKTILSGDFLQNDKLDAMGRLIGGFEDNAYQVVKILASCEGQQVVFENVLIKGGYAHVNATVKSGAGMLIAGGNVKLNGVSFESNYCAANGGAALQLLSASVKTDLQVRRCTFDGNVSEGEGGGISVSGSEATVDVQYSTFTRNKAKNGAAIIFKLGKGCYLSNNYFGENEAGQYGTISFFNKTEGKGKFLLVNNTIVNNTVSSNAGTTIGGGGSAVYMRLHKDEGKLYLINNSIMGNAAIGTDDKQISLVGALFVSEGNMYLANNAIVGNTTAHKSAGGDIYVAPAVKDAPIVATMVSFGYNVFTAKDNISNYQALTPDLIVGTTYKSANAEYGTTKNLLDLLFENKSTSGQFIPSAKNNGGQTYTVKVMSQHTEVDCSTLCSVPLENLKETTLGLDLNNDGEITGYLQYDQRGKERSTKDDATIGALEFGDFIDTSIRYQNIEHGGKEQNNYVFINGNHIIVKANQYKYTIVDIHGKTVQLGENNENISINHLPKGMYIIKAGGNGFSEMVKFIKQ